MTLIASNNTYILPPLVTNLLQINNVYEFHIWQDKHTSDIMVPFHDMYFYSNYYRQKL